MPKETNSCAISSNTVNGYANLYLGKRVNKSGNTVITSKIDMVENVLLNNSILELCA